MKEITRTLIFVAVAGVSIALAAVTHFATKPKPPEGFENIGQEFYADFDDPNEAKALKVVAYDEDTATVKEFSVEFQDGRWRIPSHHDYPADAEDRLYDTATSVIGIARGARAGRRPSSHEKFGVIDPLDENVTSLKGRGQRITLAKQDGTVLADYIIGKKVEGESEGSRYYVRQPKEDETYITELDIDLSTKFSDWIESDLLKLDSWDLIEIIVDKYSIDESRGAIVDRETSKLNREKSGDPWKLDGLDEETEEVNEDNVREMVNDLGDLKIVGVRPKPRGIRGDLSIEKEYVRSQSQLSALIFELQTKGFFVDSRDKGSPRLVANDGELIAATNDGLVYTLRFGKIFTGSEFEIEVGFASDKADKKDEKKDNAEAKDSDKDKKEAKGSDDGEKQEKKDAEKGDEKEKSPGDGEDGDEQDEEKGEDLKKNRYLFVTAQFDEKHLGDKPEKPVEPKKPAGPPKPGDAKKGASEKKEKADDSKPNKSSAAASDKGDSGGGEEAEKDDAKDDEKSDAAEKKKDDPEKKDPQAEYEEAKKKYDDDLKKYEDDQKNFEKKIEDGKKKVKELNDRFAGWYYVISAESFENLRLARKDLVKPKEKEKEEESDEDKKSEEKKPDDAKKPAAAKKPAPQKKPETAKKPAAKKPSGAEKKPDSQKPKTEKPPESKQPASPPK